MLKDCVDLCDRLTVEVVTMGQSDFSLVRKMNIKCDVLIGNQGVPETSVKEYEFDGHKATMYSYNEKGVGLNRNNLLLRGDSEIILLSDDDVVYYDDSVEKIVRAFDEKPKADAIIFNLDTDQSTPAITADKKWKRLYWFNCMRYGAPRLAIRSKVLKEKNICFSLLFGGGAKYSAGEDSLFIGQLVKSGVKIYACPETIGTVSFETSTWFNGYTEKYFYDKGIFFYFRNKRFSRLFCLQYAVRKKSLFKDAFTAKQAYRLMLKGIDMYKKGIY